MTITTTNRALTTEFNILLFGENLEEANIIKHHILQQEVNYSIEIVTLIDSLYAHLETCEHNILIFLDFERENNVNEIELVIKGANPNIKLIFLDYTYEQLLKQDNNQTIDDITTTIVRWIKVLSEKNMQSNFFSVKISPKNVLKEENIPETIVFDERDDNKSHKKLLNELKRLQTIFDLAPEGIAILNMRGYITQVNKAWLELTGYNYDEMVGKHLLRTGIIKNDEILKMGKVISAMLRGKPVETFEFKGYHKDGTYRIGSSRSRLINLGLFKKEIVLLTHDVTDRYLREMKLKSTLSDLAQINDELDDYTYAVSHDLKAPLRTIKSFGSFLLEDYSDKLDEEGQMYLRRMMGATSRMTELIEDLLTVSRIGRMNVEDKPVDFNDIINSIRLDLNAQIEEKGGEILANNLPKIIGKHLLLKQLLFNLISNGLKFNNNEAPKIWIDHYETPSEHTFSVRDNGIGIDKKHHDKIFKIFERLHPQEEFSGTGAGLTICKKIVENLKGRIWVESEPGKGSTFFFTIPKVTIDPLTQSIEDYLTITDTSLINV